MRCALSLCVLAACGNDAPPACAIAELPTATRIPLQGLDAAFGDINGDSLVDAISVGNFDQSMVARTVQVRLGLGHEFSGDTALDFTGPANAINIVIADANEDGRLDLVITSRIDGTGTVPPPDNTARISLWLGNGDGTFAPERRIFGDTDPTGWVMTVVADFNHDGHLDIAADRFISPFPTTEMNILLGNGDGTFDSPIAFPICGLHVFGAHDMNNDGKLDLVVNCQYIGPWSYYAGNGDGTFQSETPVGQGRVLAIGDLNQDARADVITANRSDGGSMIQFGAAGGLSAEQALTAEVHVGGAVIGDFNNDAKPDLVLRPEFPDTINNFPYPTRHTTLLRGNGDGTFGEELVFGSDIEKNVSKMADVDADGVADIVFVGNDDGIVHFGGGARPLTIWDLHRVTDTTFLDPPIAVGDINGDGRVDIATTKLLLAGADGFRAVALPMPAFFNDVQIADVTGDGQLDAIYTGPSSVRVLSFTGADTFDTITTPPVANAISDSIGHGVIADFDRDGRADFAARETVVTKQGPSQISVSQLTVFANDGNGTFHRIADADLKFNCEVLAAIDLDHDSFQDVVLDCGGLEIALGHGNGTFEPRQMISTTMPKGSVAVGDLDGDHIADLATANGTISIFIGNGDGTFQPEIIDDRIADARGITREDVDDDQVPDLVVSRQSERVTVLFGSANGAFELGPDVWTGFPTRATIVADVDGDHRRDFVSSMLDLVGVWHSTCR